MSRDITGVLFDKDGTLFDFNATWGSWTKGLLEAEAGGDASLMAAMADALGYDMEAERFLPGSVVVAHTVQDVSAVLLPHLPGQSQAELIVRMNALAAAAPQVEATALVPFLLELNARDLVLGVATNDSEAPARAHLRAAGVEQMFDFIAGYDSGFGGKPAPGQLHAFADAHGLRPSQCVMVGDSLHDLEAGRAAGFQTVGVLTGVAGADELAPAADAILPSIGAFLDWLES